MKMKKWIPVLAALCALLFAAALAETGDAARLAGTWRGADGDRFVLRPDGRFAHFDAAGVWDMEGEAVWDAEAGGVRLKDDLDRLDAVPAAAGENPASFRLGDAVYEKTEEAKDAELPAFRYTGGDALAAAVVDWMRGESAPYTLGEVWIPAPLVLHTDETDPQDVRVYGNFWQFRYSLFGGCLATECGGETPAMLRFAKTDAGYRLTEAVTAGDGEDYGADIQRFTADVPGLAERFFGADEAELEAVRSEYMRMYRDETGLDVRAYADRFWPEKPL